MAIHIIAQTEKTIQTRIDVSVIICSYTEERWHNLLLAVESVRKQGAAPREIIVVIDYNPTLLERVRLHIADVIALENTGPQGVSGARSTGVIQAKGELIACLDDDAIAAPDWLEKLSDCCLDPMVLGAGGTVNPQWEGTQPRWFPTEFYWVLGCSYQPPTPQPVEVRNLWAGCMCVRREIFEAIGAFRSDIGHVGKQTLGGEETELCIRAKQHWPHKKFLYEAQASIQHAIPARRATLRYFLTRCYAEGFSKAIITRYVGIKDSLSTERAYTLHMLPLGVVRGLGDCLFRFDITGLQRAAAIIAGLVTTTAGYVMGTFSPSAGTISTNKGA